MPKTLLLLLAILASSVFPRTTHAADLSGTWTASSLRVSWAVGDWGKSCGPAPSGGGERGGTVTLKQTGSGFSLSGLGRNYSSAQCWERMPGLSTRHKSAGSSAISATCKMPAGDPRQAKVVTTWYPRGDEIYFDETGQYQFVSKGSNCTASVRRTRVLTRVVEKKKEEKKKEELEAPKETEEAKKPAEPKDKPETAPPPPPQKSSTCKKPGAATSLEVTPRSKLMRPGEVFTFQVNARDAKGCRVPIQTEWTLTPQGAGTLSKKGRLSIPKDAGPNKLRIEARVGDQKVILGARIVSEEKYEELIAGGQYGVLGESLEGAEIQLTSGHVELGPSEAVEESSPNRTLLLILAGLIFSLGGAIIYLMSRSRAHAEKILPPASLQEELGEETHDSIKTEEKAVAPEPTAEPALTRLCPVCGRRYEEGTVFCGDDGARLMRGN